MLESGSVKLVALFRNIEGFRISGDGLVEVSSLAYHSDEVKSGSLFFCVPGFVHDGHRFAGAAVEKGAAALCVERLLDVDVPQVIVSSVAESMAAAAAAFYGYHRHQRQDDHCIPDGPHVGLWRAHLRPSGHGGETYRRRLHTCYPDDV